MTRLCLLVLMLGPFAAGAGGVSFHRLDLRGEGESGIFSDDVDGDGRRDLIGLSSGRVSIYRGKPGKSPQYPGMPGYSLLDPAEVVDWRAFCAALEKGDKGSGALKRAWELIPRSARNAVHSVAVGAAGKPEVQRDIANALNAALCSRDFYRQADFAGVTLPPSTELLVQMARGQRDEMSADQVQRLNRLLMEAACPKTLTPSRPPETLVTGQTAYFADVADVHPAPGKEVVLLTANGVSCFVQENGRFRGQMTELLRCDTILSIPTVRGAVAARNAMNVPVLPWNFALDIDGDGRDDLAVPHDKGTALYLQKTPGKFATPIHLGLFPLIYHFAAPGHRADEFRTHTARSVRLQIIVPSLEARDVNGDGKTDLVCGPHWFAQKVDGGFDPTPAMVPNDAVQDENKSLRLADVDGDGRKDRIMEENAVDDPLNIVTRVRVFLADKTGKIPQSPSQVIVGQNILIHTHLPVHDFNNDKTLDFAMYKTDITVTEIAKWVRQSFGKIDGNLNFYLFDPKKRAFSRRPAFIKPIRMRFKVDLMEAMMGLVWERYLSTMMRFEGDYNADGRLDLLVRDETERIALYFNTGHASKLYPEKPSVVLPDVPPFGGLALHDLNGDGADDVLLYVGSYDHVLAAYISNRD